MQSVKAKEKLEVLHNLLVEAKDDCLKLKQKNDLTEYGKGQLDLIKIIKDKLGRLKQSRFKTTYLIDCHRKRCEMKDVIRNDSNSCPMCKSPCYEKIVIIKCRS